MTPLWLHVLSIVSLAVGVFSALMAVIDLVRHLQPMWIMNMVWPITALFAGLIALWSYFTYGRLATHEKANAGDGVLIGTKLDVNCAEFLFMMQIAMVCGFATSYPVNF